MAQFQVIRGDRLDNGFVLSPERYDPRRRPSVPSTIRVCDVAYVAKEQVTPEKAKSTKYYLVLDTGNAWNGLILADKKPVGGDKIGSAKKILRSGDVIISRLRPYLRQIALVDDLSEVLGSADLACSTEFFVLRSIDGQSIAFLVPFLLSEAVQRVLVASQEGGHHPRFNQATLESLALPDVVVSDRERVSEAVMRAARSVRQGYGKITSLVLNEG